MNTPVLTETQKKHTLSAKKKLKKVTIRNVLASPFVNFWPLVKPEDAVVLNKVLREHLIEIKPPKIQVPWKKLKDIPREKRKEFRMEYSNKDTKFVDKTNRLDVVFGANEATKLLETNKASTILISDHVEPKIMVKHILDMAVLHNTPVLILPNLNIILKEQTGISSIAIAFKVNSNMAPNYLAIDLKIKEIATDYPPPSNHINFHRRDLDTTLQISTVDSTMDIIEKPERTRNLYLYRKSKSERAFAPELSKPQQSVNLVNKMEVDSSEFLAFGDTEISELKVEATYVDLNQKSKPKSKVSYKSLVIKRVSNNKDRDLKKIEILKRKR